VVALNALTFVSELVNKVGRAVRPGVVRIGDFPIVELPCRASLVRVETRSRRPIEGASYESEHSRGVLSSVPRTSRNVVEAFRRASLVRVGTQSRCLVRYFGSSRLRVAFYFS
jgi:hypothetical protein